MEILKEVHATEYFADFNEVLPGFMEKFQDKVKVFTVTLNTDFEIDLKKEFKNDEVLKKEILEFIKNQYSHIKVYFESSTLPF